MEAERARVYNTRGPQQVKVSGECTYDDRRQDCR
jgi:hypothetical protein